MKRYIEKIITSLPDAVLDIKEYTYAAVEGLRAVYAFVDGEERVLVDGCKAFQFQGEMAGGKSGVKVCPMNHVNRMALNKEFSFTAPQALGRKATSLGLGDRLGIAGPGQMDAVTKTGVKPVLAQQSLRELSLTGRSYDEVLDAAAWTVFKYGYRGGYGFDGDHLKSLEEIETALQYGVSMITLDCSLVLGEIPNETERKSFYAELPEKYREELKTEYLQDEELKKFGIWFDEGTLEETVLVYGKAVDLAERVYKAIRKCGRKVDLEISLDETAHATAVTAHYFVANELYKRGVLINSLAPRFVGEFQKAVDYIGNAEEFRMDLRAHCKVADYFGYKISVHSGSDKFAVFPVIAEETKGRFHLKTSGTSWLEAVRVIAKTEPALYRDMHRAALEHFEEASAYYVVHCDPGKVKSLEEVSDEELPAYMDEENGRQLLHITYGFMLKDNPQLRERIFHALERHAEEYRKDLEQHFVKHLCMLKCL